MKVLLSALVLMGFWGLSNWIEPANKYDSPVAASSEKPLDLQLQQACTSGDLNQITSLLNQGAAIDGVDAQGRTPLIFATCYNQIDVIKLLLNKGAKIDAQDATACTALCWACYKNNHDIAMLLIDKGANCNLYDPTGRLDWPLNSASYHGDLSLVSALIDHKIDINRATGQGTALCTAAMCCHWDVFNLLVSKGADPNIPDTYWGRTPLINAVRSGDLPDDGDENWEKALPQTRALLKAGANPNLKSKLGATPLMYACQDNLTDVAQALINAGADINATDNAGETALTYAGSRGHLDMVTLLASKGAKRLDVHIFPHAKPSPPLPAAQAWVLAMGALYNLRINVNPYVLGGEQERYKFGVQKDLKADWEIEDKAGLQQKLDDLISTGIHATAQADGAKLAAMSTADFDKYKTSLVWLIFLGPQEQPQTDAVRQSYLKWKDKSGLGYDLCLYVYLVNQGYVAGYLNEKEAWSLLLPVGQQVQKNFSSWAELGANYLDGREIAEGSRDPTFEGCFQLLTNPKDPNSPWNMCPWNTDLSR